MKKEEWGSREVVTKEGGERRGRRGWGEEQEVGKGGDGKLRVRM